MAIIELQDPLSTEIQSPTIAGTIEALNRVSKALDMSQEFIEEAPMSPVDGLDPEDPRRIYQVENGNRLWLTSPSPKIYLNGYEMSPSSSEFSIDYIGGSISFEGSYRPSQSDVITVSCAHISPIQAFGGSEIVITFSSDFIGQVFTVSGGDDETYSGIVDSTYTSTIRVKSINSEYTISAKSQDGERYSTKVSIGPYFGKYEATLASFNAIIKVSSVQGAMVTAKLDGYSMSSEAGIGGVSNITVSKSGSYTVSATYKNATSNSKSVLVSESGQQYTVSVEFITLTVTAPEGSTITAKNGATTLTDTGGTVKFYLPNTGTWTVSASLGGDSTSDSVQCNAYQNYAVELSYAPPENLNDCTWAQIHQLSAASKLGNYYDVGDGKSVILNGTVGMLNISNFAVTAFILGFNHNASREGNNKTHFALGKINGKIVALCDSQYENFASSGYFVMNGNSSNNGGWNASEMRKNTLGNSGTPSSPPTNSLLSALPAELKSVLKPVTKYTDNAGNETNSSGAVTATTDYLWLLAEFEVFGSQSYANQYEKNSQLQYDYFKAGNSQIAYKHNVTSSAVYYWLRSPSYGRVEGFCSPWTDGTPDSNFADRSCGVLAGFAV